MKRLLLVAILVVAPRFVAADDLPPLVREAVDLELQGRLGEALDRYRASLSSVEALVQDEGLAQALTVRVFSKAAHLSIDLGYGEDAWDLGGRLLAAKNQRAAEAGTLVRLRLLRLQERWAEATALFDEYAQSWPLPPPGPALLTEIQRIQAATRVSTTGIEGLVRKGGGPAAWALDGNISLLSSPSEAWDLSIQETVRLQVGAFREWAHALTLIDMLREKGWAPFTDVKVGPTGEKLHVVYLISRQPGPDRARLESQGLVPLP